MSLDKVAAILEKELLRIIRECDEIEGNSEKNENLDYYLWMQECSIRRMLREWYKYGAKMLKEEKKARKRIAEKEKEELAKKKEPEVKEEPEEEAKTPEFDAMHDEKCW